MESGLCLQVTEFGSIIKSIYSVVKELPLNTSITKNIPSVKYEKLRVIMENEQNRPVTLVEAKEYGKSLVSVYKALAGDREILGVSRQDERTESNSSTEVNKIHKR